MSREYVHNKPKVVLPDVRTETTRKRVGDVLVEETRTITHAVIEFQWLVDACKVVDDDDQLEPWRDCDGYKHELVSGIVIDDEHHCANIRHQWGYLSDRRELIVLDPEIAEDSYRYFHETLGCSKQVAREMAAYSKRRSLRQLEKWYEGGWQIYGVRLEYMDCESAVWGIDDFAYAMKDVRIDIADHVASQLEELGFDIHGKPDARANYREHRRQHYKRQLQYGCWTEE